MEKKFKKVEVKWLDAVHITHGWQYLEAYLEKAKDYANLVHCTSGYLIEDNDEYIMVALDIRKEKFPVMINMAQCIQKKMIISTKELK